MSGRGSSAQRDTVGAVERDEVSDVRHPSAASDTENEMDFAEKISQPSPLGAGLLILVTRELNGLSQRALAAKIGTSQPTLATLESGNRLPTVRTLLRVARAGGRELVIGLRRPDRRRPEPEQIQALGFDLLGVLKHNPQDDLADFDVLREPEPWEGPEDDVEDSP